ncbi:LysR family transcriptional regulator [Shewanella avicenniae]|uniref:LysR family transcriptional regulator n=1 Tax=Shewanella avicenniae TaxID=2814294 RepID=A0ABX7QU68_9GAMM|nr:LysR family transcriptional regulator [Shewanella avicenniae]QSX34393.1 LysR family transcriptional regulator [Shewanella avicenniae]
MLKGLQDLQILLETARQGSLSNVARSMDMTPAAISAAIKRVEQQLGTALFVRSTRNLRLTPQGELYLQQCEQALATLEAAEARLHSQQTHLQGQLHLSLPSDLGRHLFMQLLDEFLQLYPKVNLKLQISDHLSNLYRQPLDLLIRYGVPPDSNLISLPLVADNRRVLCASPEYIARHGAPTSPQTLSQHNCLCFMLADRLHNRWQFSRDGEVLSVEVSGDRSADDGEMVHRWALAGVGIAYKSLLDVAADITAGRLVALCDQWQGELAPLNLLVPDRRQLSPLIKTLRQFLLQRLGQASE